MFQVNKALRIDEQFQIYNIDKQFVTWKQGIFDLRFASKAEVKTKIKSTAKFEGPECEIQFKA